MKKYFIDPAVNEGSSVQPRTRHTTQIHTQLMVTTQRGAPLLAWCVDGLHTNST